MVKGDMAEVEVTEEGYRRYEQLEMENPLWRPLRGKSRKKKKKKKNHGHKMLYSHNVKHAFSYAYLSHVKSTVCQPNDP